jgi:hypothetical protein
MVTADPFFEGAGRLMVAAATTWAAEFLLREGESKECLGSWIHLNAVHEKASQAGNHMLIPMREMAAQDRRA